MNFLWYFDLDDSLAAVSAESVFRIYNAGTTVILLTGGDKLNSSEEVSRLLDRLAGSVTWRPIK